MAATSLLQSTCQWTLQRETQTSSKEARHNVVAVAPRTVSCAAQRLCTPTAAAAPARSVVVRAAAARPVAAASMLGENPEHADSDYIVLGLAQCYVKDEASKLQEIFVIEPIPAGALECMDNGGVTCYRHATATTLGQALPNDVSLLPPEFSIGQFCEDFEFRAKCAARTWKRQHAQEVLLGLVPEGGVRSDFNFSVEDKRILNMENVVTDDDNIKQDLSIDVYGRAEEGETDAEIEKLYNA